MKMILAPEDEKEIGRWALEEKIPIWFLLPIIWLRKPFYTVEDPQDPGFWLGF